jgi:hypothetical protein
MSVFGSIVSAIFGSKHAAGVTTGGWIVFAIPFIPNSVRVRDTRGRNRRKADLEN